MFLFHETTGYRRCKYSAWKQSDLQNTIQTKWKINYDLTAHLYMMRFTFVESRQEHAHSAASVETALGVVVHAVRQLAGSLVLVLRLTLSLGQLVRLPQPLVELLLGRLLAARRRRRVLARSPAARRHALEHSLHIASRHDSPAANTCPAAIFVSHFDVVIARPPCWTALCTISTTSSTCTSHFAFNLNGKILLYGCHLTS